MTGSGLTFCTRPTLREKNETFRKVQAAATQWRQCSWEHRVVLDGGVPSALQSSWMAQADAVADKRLGKATQMARPNSGCQAPSQGSQVPRHGSTRTVAIVQGPGNGQVREPGAAPAALRSSSSRRDAAVKPVQCLALTGQQQVSRIQEEGKPISNLPLVKAHCMKSCNHALS